MTISSNKVPIYIYSNVEGDKELLDKLLYLADSGIVEHHISVVPDVHIGKGATIGRQYLQAATMFARMPLAWKSDAECALSP
jgi:RNA-splicing ligase RtcB